MGAKYDQPDLDERIEMSRLYEAGTSRREIGRIIGRSASTAEGTAADGRDGTDDRNDGGASFPIYADRHER